MPEWHIEFADRLCHQSGPGNIQRARVVVERESRLDRRRSTSIGIISCGEWEAHSDIPKNAAAPRIVSMSIEHNLPAIPGLDDPVLGKRRRRNTQCGNGYNNE